MSRTRRGVGMRAGSLAGPALGTAVLAAGAAPGYWGFFTAAVLLIVPPMLLIQRSRKKE